MENNLYSILLDSLYHLVKHLKSFKSELNYRVFLPNRAKRYAFSQLVNSVNVVHPVHINNTK